MDFIGTKQMRGDTGASQFMYPDVVNVGAVVDDEFVAHATG